MIWAYLSKFYGWIPTNKGQLEINFIGKQEFVNAYIKNESINSNDDYIYTVEISLDFMNDSLALNSYKKNPDKYIETTATLNIKNDLSGNIYYSNELYNIKANFDIEDSGKIEFSSYAEKETTSLGLETETIQQPMFMLVKLFIHRDNHHHQKIDTVLKVYDEFDALKISKDILSHIKILENNTKKNNQCESQLKNSNALEEAKGYMAYLKTFIIVNDNKKELKKILKLSKNVISSMKSNIKKRNNKANNTKGIYSALFTFLGLFITINLLINGFYKEINILTSSNAPRLDILSYTFISILILFYYYIRCKLASSIYYTNYELFDILNFIKYSSLKNLSTQRKVN